MAIFSFERHQGQRAKEGRAHHVPQPFKTPRFDRHVRGSSVDFSAHTKVHCASLYSYSRNRFEHCSIVHRPDKQRPMPELPVEKPLVLRKEQNLRTYKFLPGFMHISISLIRVSRRSL